MSNRFTKLNSAYLMRDRHQKTDFGTIMERDWVTTNGLNVLRFGPGRRVWYNSGNFVFTTSNIPTYHKKHRLTVETKEWNWESCKNADGTVNEVKPNLKTNDIRNFAYYGSCVELIRATIEEIIMDFPGCLKVSNEQLNDKGFIIKNPFNIDLHHRTVTLGKYDNELRFMSNSWTKYCIKTLGGEDNVASFTIGEWLGDKKCPKNDEGKKVIDISFKTEKGKTYDIKGYSVSGNVVYVYDESSEKIVIQPQKDIIDRYFQNLKGLKAQLLRQDSKPLYSIKFKTPIEYKFNWYYPERLYVWPSDGYCIDIDSIAFTTYCDKLYDMAHKFDELWADNIYRSMTHESIKNFDWTYTREYYEGEQQNNIDGGERMQKILRLFGRVFDDVKCYIDSIKNINNVSYDTLNNGPEALLSDAVNLKGVELTSTIGQDYDINETISDEFLKENTKKDVSWCDLPRLSTHKLWYQTRNSTDIYPDICDNELMRRFSISVKRLMQTKGTQQAIDMVMGFFGFGRNPFAPSSKDDYKIVEEAYYTKKMIKYDDCIESKDINNITSRTKGELATEINNSKDLDLLYYEDPFSGVPLKTVLIGNENVPYIVPYYDPYVVYDGNLYFQSKGGWGKNIKRNDDDSMDNSFDYQETLSYLHVVGTIGELLSVNPHTVQNGDIYYVVNLKDYTQYDERPKIGDGVTLSHYFSLNDEYDPQFFSSWNNVVVKPSSKDGKIEQVGEDDFVRVFGDDWVYDGDVNSYTYCFKHVVYLENIISTNIGNNPHVGFGNYDDGTEFLEYMKSPFKYSMDKKLIGFEYEELSKEITFDDITDNKVTDKIQIFGRTSKDGYFMRHYNENNDENENGNVWYINTKVLTISNNVKTPTTYKVIEDIDNGNIKHLKDDIIDWMEYNLLDDSDKDKCVEHNLFNNYFKVVILPYLMQVIPSTTILKLKGF